MAFVQTRSWVVMEGGAPGAFYVIRTKIGYDHVAEGGYEGADVALRKGPYVTLELAQAEALRLNQADLTERRAKAEADEV